MSRHHGPAYRGRMRDVRADKRREAEERSMRAQARRVVEAYVEGRAS